MENMDWYNLLIKPPLTPDSQVFVIVWPVLYFLILLSFIVKIIHFKIQVYVLRKEVLLNLHFTFKIVYYLLVEPNPPALSPSALSSSVTKYF